MCFCRAAVVLASCLGFAAPASAGTYDVSLCRGSNGAPLGSDGWARFDLERAGASADQCSVAMPRLLSTLAANKAIADGDYVGWTFTAPAGTTIANYTLWRTFRAVHGWTSSGTFWAHAYFLGEDGRASFDSLGVEGCIEYSDGHCIPRGDPGSPLSNANRVSRSNVEVKRLYATVECFAAAPCPPTTTPGMLEIYAARIGLSDPNSPVITSGPAGPLLDSATPLTGEHALRFAVRDAGGGIARVGIVVDDRSVVSRALDVSSTRCVRPYTVVTPCPLNGDATLSLNTAQLANGRHTVQASVTDAAGNQTLSAPVTVTTLNGSQPNGRGASRFVRLNAWLRSKRDKPRRAAVVPYGVTRFAEGRLTDAGGHPISGAVLQASSRVRRPGAKYVRTGTVTTSEDGRFAYRIAKGPSRTIRFAYKAYTLDPAPVQTASVSLGVKAGIKLKLSPRRVTNGQKVGFKGKLRGGPARKGTRVTIDVLVPDARRRVPIGNVKADAKGRFKFAYRFRRTLVKARYRFQARLTPQPGYPYRGATSRRVSVVVSP
jgi:hypothetical protein